MAKQEVSNVSPLLFQGDDEQLVRAIRNGHEGASTLLYDRYVNHVQSVLTRVLGPDSELPDLTNEVFFQALKSIDSLRDPERLKAWLTRIAVFTGRKCIRGRKRRSWLKFRSHEKMPEMSAPADVDHAAVDMAHQVREIMDKMSADDQIVFSLRYMEGMEISEIAEACGFSLRTAKRRMVKCETRFKILAQSHPALSDKLESSGKWRKR